MRKFALSLAIIFFLSVITMACGSSKTGESSGEQGTENTNENNGGKTIQIDTAIFHSETDPFADTWKEWVQRVEELSGGSVQVEPFYSGSLISNADTLNAIKDGSVGMGVTAAAVMSGQIPALAQLEVLGAYPNDFDQFESLVNEIWPLLKDIFHQQEVEFLWFQGSPGAVVISPDKFFKTPEDYKGVKIRGAGRWQTEQIKSLGGNPVAVDIGEMYLALQNKTIDAALSLNTLTYSFKFYEVAPKVTDLRVPVNATFYLMNKKVWEQLPEDLKMNIDELGKELTFKSYRHLHDIQNKAIEDLKANGAEVYYLTDEEHTKFISQMSPVFEQLAATDGEQEKKLAEIMDKYRNLN